MVPVQLRAGGAFIALAVVLLLYAFVSVVKGEPLFAITPQFLCTVVAACLFGAFATTNKSVGASRTQLIVLGLAVILVGVGALLPNNALTVTQTYWLGLWGVGALLCALILRRATM